MAILIVAAALAVTTGGWWFWTHEPPTRSQPAANSALVTPDDMDTPMNVGEIRRNRERALAGDNRAANSLAHHYALVGSEAEAIHWLTVAANREDCAAMDRLREAAADRGDRSGARHWNNRLRENACTMGKAFGPTEGERSLDNVPMWQENELR